MIKRLQDEGLVFTCFDKSVFGKPDLTFPEQKIAVFIDSDFWHGNPKRFVRPKTNVEYWDDKIEKNRKRDRIVNRRLRKEGWIVLRIWEYDIKHNLNSCVNRFFRIVKKRRA
jgi:DNA mismatch endonuclease Vsr